MTVATKQKKSFRLDTGLFGEIADCQSKRLAEDNRGLEVLLNIITGERRIKEDKRTYLEPADAELLRNCSGDESLDDSVRQLCRKILEAAGM
jgi:hypothetical protein